MRDVEAWVVYETACRPVADAIADGLATSMPVREFDAGDAPPRLDPDVGLIVIGAPAHASAPTDVSRWLDGLGQVPRDVAAVAFDTRPRRSRRPGSAARAVRRRLWRRRLHTLACATFRVDGPREPLAERNRQRARDWGAHLAAGLTSFDTVVGIRPRARPAAARRAPSKTLAADRGTE